MTEHWHVEDHYSGAARLYPADQRRNMRAWVRYHGGLGIVSVELCNDPRCWTIDDDAPAPAQAAGGEAT